ncbi:unannotated protein [freshwater metagenome]|uniref:L-cysteine:1D-myo-inositol 2-amino-2-deoxy-alpha-D-glucopyranoside ligase n=1 Tax=freshwater metagenome TaxID=449393 RepID=A0A6J7XRM7_9ZZZZ|nr:cysteine--1-D-myo-inosityl 2-amino-2-deoxy-alpha-D-glucopyranoside ligase [Actinomycetota bacterium]
MNSWAEVSIPPVSSSFIFPTLSLFNSSSERVEELPKKSVYRMYVCGITPYDATHLGHAATYITFDLINRYLTAAGARVHFVENITDIDDPLLERANRDGVAWQDLAQSQIELFRGDMVDLHVIPPSNYIGAVEAIPLVVNAITRLQERGTIYPVDADLYYEVRADPQFGTRAHLDDETSERIFSERGGDPHRAGKKDPLDCLVWMSQREGEPGWDSPWGTGRPGWHIECSAIALHYLESEVGDDYSIDIQGGGSDLIFPHHEMGASQAHILGGHPFARLYVHSGMIGLDGEKMSKSLGNLVFVSKLVASGVNPMAIRLALLSGEYRADRMWTSSQLDSAIEFLDELRIALSREETAPTSHVIQEIVNHMSNDLNTVGALESVKSWVRETNRGSTGGSPGELSRAIDALLGIAI